MLNKIQKFFRFHKTKGNLLNFAIIAAVNLIVAYTLLTNCGAVSKNIAEANAVGSSNMPFAAFYKRHNLPRLRGAMVNPNVVTEEDLRILGKEWNANLVRWQFNWAPWNDKNYAATDMNRYDRWLEMEMTRLDKFLPVCKKYGLKVLIDLHTTPGGRDIRNESLLFKEKRYQDHFLSVWDRIARRYKGRDVVWGYDLANEPLEGKVADGVLNWQSLVEVTAKKVRFVDKDHAIIVEPAPWGNPEGLKLFKPLPVSGVVYSVHMYNPHDFTHQGVDKKLKSVSLSYPGIVNKVMWDKNQLRRSLQSVVSFQHKYGVHIYIGEFSAVRWAPDDSTYNYLKDVIDIFEENEWDWTYHAFREWHGWSVEHGRDQKDETPTKVVTDRALLLQSWFRKNIKPFIIH